MGNLCRGPDARDDDDDGGDGEQWEVASMTVEMNWPRIESPYECPKFGAVWHRVES